MRDARSGGFQRIERPVLEASEHKDVTPLVLPTVGQLRSGGTNVIRLEADNRPSFEEQLSMAFDEGRREGVLAGERRAEERLAEAKQSALQLATALQHAMSGLSTHAKNSLAVVESDLVALALEVAKEIIGQEPAIDETRLRNGVRAALAHIDPEIEVRVRLNPRQFDELLAVLPELSAGLSKKVELVPDEGIELGGSIVEAGPTRIDTQISSAIERLHRVLSEIEGATA
ncbi:MAG: FliH/SctL family protein [Acidimicrobiales bacterium]